MRTIVQPELVIFSVSNNLCKDANKIATACVEARLKEFGASFKRVLGFWDGEAEQSFVIALSDNKVEELAEVRALTKLYAQDAVMRSRSDRTSYLEYSSGEIEELGTLKTISRKQAIKLESFTYDTFNKTYWACA